MPLLLEDTVIRIISMVWGGTVPESAQPTRKGAGTWQFTARLLRRYRERTGDPAFETLNDYLDAYLVKVAKHRAGGDTRLKHDKAFVKAMVE